MPDVVAGGIYYMIGTGAIGAMSTAAVYTWAYAITIVAVTAYTNYTQGKAKARARAAANEAAKDREMMIRSAIAPRRYVYGRDRISGPIVFMQSTGDKGEFLHVVLALAAHECDAIEDIYFNEIKLPTPDVDGWINSGEFAREVTTESGSFTGTTNGSGQLTLPHTAIAVTAAFTQSGQGDTFEQTQYAFSHAGNSALVTGLPPDFEVTIGYTYLFTPAPLVRIRKHLGGAGQVADEVLIEESGGTWTEDHVGNGICYLYIRLEFDQDVFGSVGLPNISAVVRGRKVPDPRTDVTVWSENAQLCVAHYLRSYEGMRATADELPEGEVIAGANVCDEAIDLSEDDDDTQKRYTLNFSYTTQQSPRDVLADALSAMAGRAVWTQGRWLLQPGCHRTPALTITPDMIIAPISVVARASRSELFNAVRPTHRDIDRDYTEVQAPIHSNEQYEAEDGGVRIVRQIDLPVLADTYRAQRIAKIELERHRQALTVRCATTLAAYDLAPTDTVMLNWPLYGWSNKVFEVVERTLSPQGILQYTLRETAAGVWDWNFGEATVGDLAPNTDLPSPYGRPPTITGLAIEQEAVMLGDGSVIMQAVLSWDAVEDVFVTQSGRVEVEWAVAGSTSGDVVRVDGMATSAVLRPTTPDIKYIARARAVNAIGRRSDWAYISWLAVDLTSPPPNVTGLDWEIKPGQVVITCDPCPAKNYADTELRFLTEEPEYDDSDWAAASFLVRGASTEYQHARPPNGTYYVLAKHRNRGGLYSEDPAYITVVVDDSIDGGGSGVLALTTDRFPFFSFANGTTHTATAPGDGLLTFTAQLIGLFGTATFAAEAFDNRVGGASLGTFSLGGSGNARTMSAAQFVGNGTSGSVRRVRVTATLGSASDFLDVYRQDSTTTAPILFLSNPQAAVATDEAGEYGDYSGARTDVVVFAGIADVTDDFDFAITSDMGVTATINGGAGPITGEAPVEVAVSAMTVPDGAVLIEATDGVDDLSASFVVTKREASGTGYTVVWDPRDEVVLPVDGTGAVLTFDDAWSELHIIKGGQLDDTVSWALTKEDVNVVSTLTGARVDVTALLAMASLGTPIATSLPWSANGWSRVGPVIDAGDWWLATGFNASSPYTKVERSPKRDFEAWDTVDHGVSGQWNLGDYALGVIVLAESAVGSTNKTLRSTDGGATWSSSVALPTSSQWYHLRSNGAVLQISSQVSTTGAYSTNGGASWSSRTYPATGMIFFPGPGAVWASRDTMGNDRISLDNGATWSTTTTGLPGSGIWDAKGFAGRLVATAWADTDKVAVWEPGTGWMLVTLPEVVRNGQLSIIRGVLYLVDANFSQVLYSFDGKTWKSGASSSPADSSQVIHHSSLSIDFFPDCDSTSARKHPLLATSDMEGSVIVTATKPGELPIRAALPVRKATPQKPAYLFAAYPASLGLQSTSDGVVIDFSNATITPQAFKDGLPDPDWTFTWTAINMTPSSGSGGATFTAMDPAQDTGQVKFVGSKPGEADITGVLNVWKIKGTAPSGPVQGGAFHAIAVDGQTLVGLKWTTTGMVQVKKGTGGSYVDLLPWAMPQGSGNSSNYLRVTSSGHVLSTGTTGTRLAMTTDREFVLSDTNPGQHVTNLTFELSSDNVGSNAIVAFGSLILNV